MHALDSMNKITNSVDDEVDARIQTESSPDVGCQETFPIVACVYKLQECLLQIWQQDENDRQQYNQCHRFGDADLPLNLRLHCCIAHVLPFVLLLLKNLFLEEIKGPSGHWGLKRAGQLFLGLWEREFRDTRSPWHFWRQSNASILSKKVVLPSIVFRFR